MHKSTRSFREKAKLDYPDCPFLLGNSLGLNWLLGDPHSTFCFQRKRTYIYLRKAMRRYFRTFRE
jgi:hypothetical protein